MSVGGVSMSGSTSLIQLEFLGSTQGLSSLTFSRPRLENSSGQNLIAGDTKWLGGAITVH